MDCLSHDVASLWDAFAEERGESLRRVSAGEYPSLVEVSTGLYVGGSHAAGLLNAHETHISSPPSSPSSSDSLKRLRERSITVIVCCCGDGEEWRLYEQSEGIHYVCADLPEDDNGVTESGHLLGSLIQRAVPLLRDAWRNGESVLVHCRDGMSRSVSVVCGLLMAEYNFPFLDAFRTVLSSHPVAIPSFWRYLQSPEFSSLLNEVRVCDDRLVLSADDVVQITNLIHLAMHYLDTGESGIKSSHTNTHNKNVLKREGKEEKRGEVKEDLMLIAVSPDISGDGQKMSEIFSPPASLTVVLANKIVRKSGLPSFYRALHERFLTTRHWEGNVVLTCSSSRVFNQSYWLGRCGADVIAEVPMTISS
jgi:hypothetical protein